MKRLFGLAVSAVLLMVLLCGCMSKEPRQTREISLTNSGVTLRVSSRQVSESATTWFSRDTSVSRDAYLITSPDITTIAFDNACADEVTVEFVWSIDNGYMEYDLGEPIEKVDYTPVDAEDGVLTYRFDTAYLFCITVTTEQGTDLIILDCCREI